MNMKQLTQHHVTKLVAITFLGILLLACEQTDSGQYKTENGITDKTKTDEIVKGPHGGRLLHSGDFTLELAIFEDGTPPEFRAWVAHKNQPVSPTEVELKIVLTRLSSDENFRTDEINFNPEGDALRGDRIIYEPHSFVVDINAMYKNKNYNWQYDNFEGRTKIEAKVAQAMGIESAIAGPVVIQETLAVFGQVVANTELVSKPGARFAGIIKSVNASIGKKVRKGQVLATVESNESLNVYTITAPISGVLTQRNANPGEYTSEKDLFTITDTSTVWVDLSIFPKDIMRVKTGAPVSITLADETTSIAGTISYFDVIANPNQSITARVVVANKNGLLLPGSTVKATITVGEYAVPLAVKRSGLQAFRDFTVVYAHVGDEYEVRMLELGRQDSEWVEVLGGLQTGTLYVSENSYVIKADIEKSGAAHDH